MRETKGNQGTAPLAIGIWGLQWFMFWTAAMRFLRSLTSPPVLPLKITQHLPSMACSLNGNCRGLVCSQVFCSDEPFTLCYLAFFISVSVWGLAVDLTKSLVITSSSPSLRMQRWTTRRTFCNLRSRAKRWGSVRIGCKGSPCRDSLIRSLSLNSGRIRSCSLNRVERFTMQHWDSGARMDISSWECFPNPLALSKWRRNPSSPNLVKIS